MALYNWTDGELVTAEKLNSYGSGMETIKSDTEKARDDAQAAAKEAEQTLASKAPINSPALTGTPTAPTPDTGDSSTRLATTEFVDKYHDSLDLGDFVDADLAEHIADVNAHSGIVIDAMATAATTQDTLDTHKSAEDSHGNLTVDGGDLRDPKKYRNQETLEEHETASYAHSNLVIEGGTV